MGRGRKARTMSGIDRAERQRRIRERAARAVRRGKITLEQVPLEMQADVAYILRESKPEKE